MTNLKSMAIAFLLMVGWTLPTLAQNLPTGLYRGGADAAKVGNCNNNAAPGFCQTGIELSISKGGKVKGRFGHGTSLYQTMLAGQPFDGNWSTAIGAEIQIDTQVKTDGDKVEIDVSTDRTLLVQKSADGSLVGILRYVSHFGGGIHVTDTPYTLKRVGDDG